MKLIVGLGNPGSKYVGTRHNVGFVVLAKLAEKYSTLTPRAKFQGEVTEGTIGGEKVLLLTPLTFMNLSGASVLAARDFYTIELQNLLIICDDFALPLAKLRFRAKGSSSGQKGLEDVIRRLGTDEFPRLRMGIGTPVPGRDVTGYVLGRFTKDEQPDMEAAIARATTAAADWSQKGIDYCMTQYNG
jgi:PTH1 family peptidyl-tRNA hydrolase